MTNKDIDNHINSISMPTSLIDLGQNNIPSSNISEEFEKQLANTRKEAEVAKEKKEQDEKESHDTLMRLNPTANEANKKGWEKTLDVRIKEDSEFLYRCMEMELLEADIRVICDTLEDAGKDGMTVDVVAARLGLLGTEMYKICKKYPKIERAVKISRVNRKGHLQDAMTAGAHRSAATAKMLVSDPNLSKDEVEVIEEEESSRRPEDVLVQKLIDKRVEPQEYTQMMYIVGDLDNPRDLPPKDGYKELKEGYVSAKDALSLFFSQDKSIVKVESEEVENKVLSCNFKIQNNFNIPVGRVVK